MERVRRRVRDRKVLRLVLAFLKADIMIEGNRWHPVTGTPQGGILAPERKSYEILVPDQVRVAGGRLLV